MDTPEDLRYTAEHEWAKIEGEVVIIGITDFAQEALGEIVYVELPDHGDEISRGETFGAVESTKSVSDLLAPVGGEVAEVNESLIDSPEIINSDPYVDGWIVKFSHFDTKELEELMNSDEYSAYIQGEIEEE